MLLTCLVIPRVYAAQAPRPIKLGLWPYHSAHFLLGYYEGLRAQLESRIRQPVQLETAPSVAEFVGCMSRGEYDLAIMGPHIARLAQTDYGWKPVARYQLDNTVYIVAIADRSMLMTLVADEKVEAKGLKEGDVEWQETGGLASSVYAVISGQADAAVTTLASLSLTPQRDADKLKILANAGKILQLFMMAAPDISNYGVEVATAACLSYRREGEVPLAKLNLSQLRALDSCADQACSLYKAHLSPVGSNSK